MIVVILIICNEEICNEEAGGVEEVCIFAFISFD